MIKLNDLLRAEGLNPDEVKLVRHQDYRHKGGPTLYQVWRASEEEFELYQRIQSRPRFKDAKLIASFLATPLGETLFVGLYEVGKVAKAPQDLMDPVTGANVGGCCFYSLCLSPHLSDYRGRLVVNWGPGYRAWVQHARNKDKPVVEIRRSLGDPPFPGFLNFREQLKSLATVPTSWRQTLSAVSGVYLLKCLETGKQYVGSASGVDGFWGRWEAYAASGHGGNKRMIDIPAANYQVSILEVASSSVSSSELFEMERRWKEKLVTRGKFGLNAN